MSNREIQQPLDPDMDNYMGASFSKKYLKSELKIWPIDKDTEILKINFKPSFGKTCFSATYTLYKAPTILHAAFTFKKDDPGHGPSKQHVWFVWSFHKTRRYHSIKSIIFTN